MVSRDETFFYLLSPHQVGLVIWTQINVSVGFAWHCTLSLGKGYMYNGFSWRVQDLSPLFCYFAYVSGGSTGCQAAGRG